MNSVLYLCGVSIFAIVAAIFLRSILVGSLVRLLPKERPVMSAALPKVSIVVPAYNEGPAVYQTLQSLSQSDYPRELLDIIAIDDCSTDDTAEWLERAAHDFGIRYRVLPRNGGKQLALIAGFNITTGDVVAMFDSDVRVTPSVLRGFVRELQDPGVGIVGASCGIYNPNDSLLSQAYTSVFYAMHLWIKRIESRLGFLTVVDGKGIALRREVYARMVPLIENQLWLGLKIMAGEDGYLTHQLTRHGYRSVMIDEHISTSAPPTVRDLYNQQMRWRRSTLRELFWFVADLPHFVRHSSVRAVLSNLLARASYFVVPCFYLFVLVRGGPQTMLAALAGFVLLVFVFRVLLNLHARAHHPDQVVRNPFLSGVAMAAWFFVDFSIGTFLALLTLDEGGWGTRDLGSGSQRGSHPPNHLEVFP